ncbi:hypothetical protein H2203_001140 [Taxawa tesnikishii (nom. ined.)]|nr:hypothetical protein H2203_001140 [Dothideales sp. JES 119]
MHPTSPPAHHPAIPPQQLEPVNLIICLIMVKRERAPVPVYSETPQPVDDAPSHPPPEYTKRTPSQEALYMKELRAWAAEKEMMVPGAYMETFRVGDKVVTNGRLAKDSSTQATSSSSSGPKSSDDAAEATDSPRRESVGRRMSSFMKKISPAERAQRKFEGLSDEEPEEKIQKESKKTPVPYVMNF